MNPRALLPVVIVLLAAPSAASAAFPHVVAPGESLSSVAASDGLSVEQLAAANGLSMEAPLLAGSILMIPSQTAPAPSEAASSEALSSEAAPGEGSDGDGDADDGGIAQASGAEGAPAGEAAEGGSYVVQPGDSLTAIAARAGTSVEGLAAANGLDAAAPLLIGTVLRLPGASVERAAAPEEAAAAGPPYPTEETVTPSEVGSIAAEHGVPPSLADAVAEQESGFNNGLTSSANARGVMQILPQTWSFISQNLAGSPPLAPASASSNVRGGVLLLQWLLNETGGDPGLAAAGYYQGLDSVRREGEYPETEQYVNNVLALQRRFAGE
jgi:soluble lytic murein transglycosylase-like protein